MLYSTRLYRMTQGSRCRPPATGRAREPRPGQHNEVGIMSQTLELGGPLRLGDPGPLPAESESLAQSDSESAGDSRLGLVTR